ncbi:MAG: 3-phosphoshikimate 1-carboxyvinyltransferase [Alphaproteobacteria bacterium]|nr:3-phosphoshikimate 1-carboxyvinyltransferase [Alphaproteobacteria bacterium]
MGKETARVDQGALQPLSARAGGALKGTARVPGDKSISHRALLLSAAALGETRIEGLLEGADVLATVAAVRALGASVERLNDGAWRVRGQGVGGQAEPFDIIDCGNSGTGARLLCGLMASQPFTAFVTGDASLRRRPMMRVIEPLTRMGARFTSRAGGRLPLALIGARDPLPIEYAPPAPSAQVKSAILLAALNTPGETTVVERAATRDHSERMLRYLGAEVRSTPLPGGGARVTLVGERDLIAKPITVPADPSSAAFPAVAAAIIPGSAVTLTGICVNPGRIGLYTTLAEMGASLSWSKARDIAGEPVSNLTVTAGKLHGVEVPAARAPSMIDEYPILAMAAACATGVTVLRGLAELRVKESDRLTAIARGLTACGVKVEESAEELVIHGLGRPPKGGANIVTDLDHRIAMSFLVLGLAAERPVVVDDGRFIDTSFPGFVALMRGLGATIDAA